MILLPIFVSVTNKTKFMPEICKILRYYYIPLLERT